MNLSKSSEYALRILIYMANHNQGPISAQTIHEELELPYKYITKLLTRLSKEGFIQSIKGRDGGFVITKPLAKIKVITLVESVEGPDYLDKCFLGFGECDKDHPCQIHEYWAKAKAGMVEVFKTLTLQDLINDGQLKY